MSKFLTKSRFLSIYNKLSTPRLFIEQAPDDEFDCYLSNEDGEVIENVEIAWKKVKKCQNYFFNGRFYKI